MPRLAAMEARHAALAHNAAPVFARWVYASLVTVESLAAKFGALEYPTGLHLGEHDDGQEKLRQAGIADAKPVCPRRSSRRGLPGGPCRRGAAPSALFVESADRSGADCYTIRDSWRST